MFTYLGEFLRSNPAALLFAVLGLGYLVGKTSIRGFELGSSSYVLFVELVTGRFGCEMGLIIGTLTPVLSSCGLV